MFEKLKKRVAKFILARKYLKKNWEALNFRDSIKKSVTAFIILPSNDSDFHSAFQVVEYLFQNGKAITLCIKEHKYNEIPKNDRFKYLSYHFGQINRIGLPLKSVIDRFSHQNYDLVIDLNREEDLFLLSLLCEVKSSIRLGFHREGLDGYYNFLVGIAGMDAQKTYENLIKYLKMF
ncbi:MAG: hypothetical protein KF816_12000 [Melioribacteraceae bacterium]|jgi:hypothetical protein|nr:hypothetical protein [Melioribacteraceae bacterium]